MSSISVLSWSEFVENRDPPHDLTATAEPDGSVLLRWQGGRSRFVLVSRDNVPIFRRVTSKHIARDETPGQGHHAYRVWEIERKNDRPSIGRPSNTATVEVTVDAA